MSLNFIPGYAEAVAREMEAREVAMLGVPYSICGVDIRIMTVADYLALSAAKHPFVVGGVIPGRVDIASFLWFLSPQYVRPGPWFANRKRSKFARKALRLNYADARDAIDEYLDLCFLDCPLSNGVEAATPSTSWVVSAQHILAKTYGWTPQTIRSLTLPEYFQHLRRIHMDNRPGYTPISKWSGEAKDRFLNKLNDMPEAEREAFMAKLGHS